MANCMKKIKASQFRGMTPAQIKKAIYGEEKLDLFLPVLPTNKRKEKPEKTFRQQPASNNGLLMSLPFSTTHTASLYNTPNWFANTQQTDVSVIVPLYGTSAKSLLDSWDVSNDGLKVEFIFIDDNCHFNSKDLLIQEWASRKSEFKNGIGKIYTSSVTQGWCACCNIGAEKASSDIIVFLHPDSIVTKGWLRPLVRLARKSDVGAVGAVRLMPDGVTFLDAGSEWSWAEGRFMHIGQESYSGHKLISPFRSDNCPENTKEAIEQEVVSAYCMATRREAFRYMGGFCPNLSSVQWAEADYCCAIKESNGFKIISQGASKVIMPNPVESEKKWEQGKTYFQNKWLITSRLDSIVSDKRPTEASTIESIVIRRRAAHGDVLLAAAVAPALKKKYPKAKIIFCTDCPEVVQNNPWIDKVVEAHSERWFQLYHDLDMAYEYRPKTNILEAYADAVGVKAEDCDLFLQSEPVNIDLPEKYVVMHAGKTLWVGRNWSTLKFDQISSRIRSKGYSVVCVGTSSDHKTSVCDLDLRDKTTIPQLATVIMKAKLFVGIDSFPMHVAQVFEVPGICFFGSINPETRLLENSSITPVSAGGMKCLGCHHRRPTPCTSTTICEVGVQDCINSVSADHMWAWIDKMI
jgi:ADP-heptose:LPS heptosyltransferase/GT2 family glycosyltransferase